MGIQNLLKILSSITQSVDISHYNGESVGIDGYCWLHKGASHCCYELCNDISTNKHIDYFIDLVKLLLHHKIKPIIVFDGCHLPSKQIVENSRAQKRKESLKIAHSLDQEGHKSKALQYYSKAVDITPYMAFQCIQVIKSCLKDKNKMY
ncbi:hypothetical protein RFI_13230 [Reticulomyxa filosa]|uniref:XPG N-terminal domain-containing protein n=1 Tax=Reticulomyxa filosa TaxID=46433 RepID=X6ND90_RETFI|nr:hypothetical protein RFI_13230 [Reticulomyxa filosa]|eukprot:ETO23931.1 hypothetical protein RFI_13230 [Reticulomyxa filosa]